MSHMGHYCKAQIQSMLAWTRPTFAPLFLPIIDIILSFFILFHETVINY